MDVFGTISESLARMVDGASARTDVLVSTATPVAIAKSTTGPDPVLEKSRRATLAPVNLKVSRFIL